MATWHREAAELAKKTMEQQLAVQAAAKAQKEAEAGVAKAREEAKNAARAKAREAKDEFEKSVENRRSKDKVGLKGAAVGTGRSFKGGGSFNKGGGSVKGRQERLSNEGRKGRPQQGVLREVDLAA